jgi:hypothetical protein
VGWRRLEHECLEALTAPFHRERQWLHGPTIEGNFEDVPKFARIWTVVWHYGITGGANPLPYLHLGLKTKLDRVKVTKRRMRFKEVHAKKVGRGAIESQPKKAII